MGDSRATQGAFRLARTLDAYATITRNFRALHFVSPLWSFPVVVQVSIDNITQTIDLQDYSVPTTKFPPTGMSRATQPSQIVWTFYGVDEERTVIVSTGQSDSGPVAVVDRLIFEVAEPGDLPTLSPGSPPRTTLLAYPSATTSSSILPPASSPRDSSITIHNQPSTRQALQEKAKRQGLIAIIVAIFVPITLVLLGALVACLLIRKRYDAFRVRRMRSSAWIRGSGLFGGSHGGMSPLRDEEVVMWPKKGGLTEAEPTKQSFDSAYSNDWSLKAPYAVTTPVLNFHIPFTRKPSDVAAHHSGDDPASPIDEENAYTESEHSVELHPSGSHEVYVLPKQFCDYVQHPVPPTSESLLSPIPPKASMPRALHTSHAVIREAHTRDSSISGRSMWTVPRSISSRSGTIDTWSSFGNHPLSSRMTERTNIVDSQRRSEEFSPVSPLGLDEADNESLSSHYPSTQWHEVIPGLTIPFGRFHAPVVRHSIPVPTGREELSRF
ncbi:hypothetical protein BJ165DRAFT_1534285 [Panaeolus papilionaceus]|nr:hypothetical protein BJ165DRAFT_1534285 [Panaeolus papilionaceus]